jgi:transcription elongation factor GreA
MKAKTEHVSYLTVEGLAEAKAELERLSTVGRKEIIQKLEIALEYGNLDENGDYEVTRNEQAFLEGRIGQLSVLIRDAVVIDEPKNNRRVTLGSVVEVTDEDGIVESYTLVGSTEASPASGRISNESPLGAALLGKELNESVLVQAPAGQFRYTITGISS